MSNQISPKYQMNIIQNINDKLYELFKSYDDVEAYVCKWQVFYDDFGNANFYIQYKDNEHKKIDLKKTLHQIDGETLLKIAIDLGLDTPDFIPSIPMFKNELKSSFETAAQTFEKAYCNVEKDPSLAIGLANSALESFIIHDSLCAYFVVNAVSTIGLFLLNYYRNKYPAQARYVSTKIDPDDLPF